MEYDWTPIEQDVLDIAEDMQRENDKIITMEKEKKKQEDITKSKIKENTTYSSHPLPMIEPKISWIQKSTFKSTVKKYIKIYMVEPLYHRNTIKKALQSAYINWKYIVDPGSLPDISESERPTKIDDVDKQTFTQHLVNSVNEYLSYYSELKNIINIPLQGNVEESPDGYESDFEDFNLNKKSIHQKENNINEDEEINLDRDDKSNVGEIIQEFKMIYYDKKLIENYGKFDTLIKDIKTLFDDYPLPEFYSVPICLQNCHVVYKFIDTLKAWSDKNSFILSKETVDVANSFTKILLKTLNDGVNTTYLCGNKPGCMQTLGRNVYEKIDYIDMHALCIALLQYITFCNSKSYKLHIKLLQCSKNGLENKKISNTLKTSASSNGKSSNNNSIPIIKSEMSEKEIRAKLHKFKCCSKFAQILHECFQQCNKEYLKWNVAIFTSPNPMKWRDSERVNYLQQVTR